MSNRSDFDPRYTEHTSDQIIKGNETVRRENAVPVQNYGNASQVRHRRSDRSSDDYARASGAQQRRRNDSRYDDRYEDLPPEKRSVVPFILIALGVVLLLVAGYLFLPENSPIKKQVSRLIGRGEGTASVEVIEFKTSSAYYTAESRVPFTITTSPQAKSVRLLTESGNALDGTPVRNNPEDTTMAIWTITVLFQEPYEGLIYASALDANGNWINSSKTVSLTVLAPTAEPAPTPSLLPTQALSAAGTQAPQALVTAVPVTAAPAPVTERPLPTDAPAAAESAAPQTTAIVSYAAVATAAPAAASAETQAPFTQAPDAQSTETAVTQAPAASAETAATPSPVPESIRQEALAKSEPTPVPTPAPLTASAAEGSQPSALGLAEEVYSSAGKVQNDYLRTIPLVMQETGAYTFAATGVHTFRGDNMRQNAAFGTTEVHERTLTPFWEYDLSGLRTADAGTLYGVGWNNQPAIVKWPREIRMMMNLKDSCKSETSMREVIFSGQDGRVYFINLTTGEASRDPINIKYPMRGSVSVQTEGEPIISFGQAISKLPDKTGAIGYYLYSLLDQKQLYFINGRSTSNQKQYSSNGAFDGCSLFVHRDGQEAMLVAGENGLLYAVDLGTNFKYKDENPTLTVSPQMVYQRSLARGEKEARTTIESAIAMYNTYVYTADGYGIIRCVDTNTMKSVWAFDAGDNTDAAIALDETDGGIDLYTGNTAFARLGKNDPVTIRRLDALSGEEIWHYEIMCERDTKNETSGCKASPVVGQNDLSSLVFFTVNRVQEGGSRLVALSKEDGHLVWEFAMEESQSSPVAVYNESGNGWIIAADSAGNIYFLDGLTGYLNSTTTVDGRIEASPAVYKNYYLIGTCSKTPKMYCFKIQ